VQRSGSPSGRLTLGLIEPSVGEIAWCRRIVSSDELLIFSPGGDNESVSRPGFRGSLVSYPEEYLELTAENLEVSVNFGPYRDGGIALHIGMDAARNLRRHFQRLEYSLTLNPNDAARRIRDQLDNEIAAHIVKLLASQPRVSRARVGGFKARAARTARDYIEAHAAESPSIENVTRAAEVSWRSLNYAFRELFGVTPKQYLQATRLDRVRTQLRQLGPEARISDVANEWGFWHMGQFARDYRRQFGELPSETACRARLGVA